MTLQRSLSLVVLVALGACGESSNQPGASTAGAQSTQGPTPPVGGGGGTAADMPARAGAGPSSAGSRSVTTAGRGGVSPAGGSGGDEAESGGDSAAAGSNGGDEAGSSGSSGEEAAAAGSAGEPPAAGSGGEAPDSQCPVVVADADCDKSQRPFVFVHGTYGSGDNIAHVAELFGSNGFCQDRFVAVEYNSVLFLNNDPSPLIDEVVDAVLAKTGMDQVDIACHSQGTYQCTNYMSQAARAAKVAHYINLSGGVTVPNDVETLSISSENDLGGAPAHATNATERVTYTDMDHMGVASSTEAFVDMWKYLHDGQAPQYTTAQCGADPITIESIVETFADNVPIANAKVEAFEIGANARERGAAAATAMSDAKGRVPPFQLKRNVQYELQATDSSGKVLARLYYAPFKRSNHLVRFLAPSTDQATLEASTGQVAMGEGFSAALIRYLGGAFRHDLGETLSVTGGNDVLTDMTAGKTMVSVGLYMSDQNKNGMSEYGQSFTSNFLVGTDVFIDAASPAFIEFNWKDPFGAEVKLKVPNWPSSEGIIAVMLP